MRKCREVVGRMDWKYSFLYNLWHYIPGKLSLKIKCGPSKVFWKVLKKWLQFFLWMLVYHSCLSFTNISTSHIHFLKLKPISGLYEFNVAIANSLYITCNFEVILLIWMFLVFQPITVKMVTGKWEDDILEKLSQKFKTIFFKFHIN